MSGSRGGFATSRPKLQPCHPPGKRSVAGGTDDARRRLGRARRAPRARPIAAARARRSRAGPSSARSGPRPGQVRRVGLDQERPGSRRFAAPVGRPPKGDGQRKLMANPAPARRAAISASPLNACRTPRPPHARSVSATSSCASRSWTSTGRSCAAASASWRASASRWSPAATGSGSSPARSPPPRVRASAASASRRAQDGSSISAAWCGWMPTAASTTPGCRLASSSAASDEARSQPGTQMRSIPASIARAITSSRSASKRGCWRWACESTRPGSRSGARRRLRPGPPARPAGRSGSRRRSPVRGPAPPGEQRVEARAARPALVVRDGDAELLVDAPCAPGATGARRWPMIRHASAITASTCPAVPRPPP